MKSFHVNAKGEPGVCQAVQDRCPFGQHFASKQEARIHFEAKMQKNVVITEEKFTQDHAFYQTKAQEYKDLLSEEEICALEAYTGQDYHAINTALWQNMPHALTSVLDTAIAKSTFCPRQVYRKPAAEDIEALLEEYQVGAEIKLPGYSSTTSTPTALFPLLHRELAPAYRELDQSYKNVIFELRGASGAPVGAFSSMPQEKEWLLPRNVQGKVLAVEEKFVQSEVDILGYKATDVEERKAVWIVIEVQ